MRTKSAMKIDQVSCTAHYFCKVEVQGTHIIGRIVDVGAGGRQCSLSDNVFWPLVARRQRPTPLNSGGGPAGSGRRVRESMVGRSGGDGVHCVLGPPEGFPVPRDRASPPVGLPVAGRFPWLASRLSVPRYTHPLTSSRRPSAHFWIKKRVSQKILSGRIVSPCFSQVTSRLDQLRHAIRW